MNDSDEAVRITGLSLVDARNFDLAGAYELPLDGMIAGTLIGWPPRSRSPLRPLGQVEPGARINLVVHLKSRSGEDGASLERLRITYEKSGMFYQAETGYSVVWRKVCR